MPLLHFKGKPYVQNLHLSVKYHQLEAVKENGLNEKPNLQDNLVIQGDNLLAMKALLPNYAGKIKCIYIDPPYNTGNEGWAYNDNVNSPMIQEWLGKTIDNEDLAKHDKWLCMMLPRLKMMRELLSDDGVIFVSIDDNEVHHLRMLMDEVFGSENFTGQIANINNPKGRSDDKFIATSHEYLLIYAKGKYDMFWHGFKPDEKILIRYKKENEAGKYREIDLRKTGDNDRKEDRPNLFYFFLFNKETKEFYPTKKDDIPDGFIKIYPTREDGTLGNWRWSIESAKEKIHLLFPKYMSVRKKWGVFEKDYLKNKEIIKPTSSWAFKDINSERGSEQMIELGFTKESFSKPKPIGLLKRILQLSMQGNDLILDAFAGSGTTAQAVLDLNKEDGGNRKFILIESEHYANEITAERVRRVIKGVPTSKNDDLKKGYGGSFSFYKVGAEINESNLLSGNGQMPNYSELARFIYFNATGEIFDESQIDIEKNFIGKSKDYEMYLYYEPNIESLRKLAFNYDMAEALGSPNGRRRLVFAPMKYLDSEFLAEKKIDFCHLPFEIYKVNA